MLEAKVDRTGDQHVVFLAGMVNEEIPIEDLLGNVQSPFIVNCRGVISINSAGIKSWIAFFNTATEDGKKYSFTECSPPIVEQMSVISNFLGSGTVLSVLLPYACENCQHEQFELMDMKVVASVMNGPPAIKCVKCEGKSSFDDDVGSYFEFAKKG